jgi:hypothetical protein
MRRHLRFALAVVGLAFLGCAEAPAPKPPQPAQAPLVEEPQTREPDPAISKTEREGAEDPFGPSPRGAASNPPATRPEPVVTEPAEPSKPSTGRAVGNALRRAFGIPVAPSQPREPNGVSDPPIKDQQEGLK